MLFISGFSRKSALSIALFTGLTAASLFVGCGGDADGTNDGEDVRPMDGATGAVCEAADDCFDMVADGDLQGEAQCLDRVEGGYCTHTCTADEDCCAAEGECPDDENQVCSPFESTGQMLCFLSCEPEDLEAAQDDWEEPPEDANDYCQRGAAYDFICRSSGGGADNRQVCVPGDCGVGEDCTEDADCDGDLICLTDFDGGYCTQDECTEDADCPMNSVCANEGGHAICLKECTQDSDCSFCRTGDNSGTCDDDADLVESEGVSVCRPLVP